MTISVWNRKTLWSDSYNKHKPPQIARACCFLLNVFSAEKRITDLVRSNVGGNFAVGYLANESINRERYESFFQF